jgi:hypothetical protein
VAGGTYQGRWRLARVRRAWEGHAMVSSAPGSTLKLSYAGGAATLIGDSWPQGGQARVTVDGRSHTISFHSKQPHARQVVFRAKLGTGRHRLTIQALRGVVAIEGLAISNRTG